MTILSHAQGYCVTFFVLLLPLSLSGEGVRGEKKMNFLWVEDFPLFLPREDGLPGGSNYYNMPQEFRVDGIF